MADDMQAEINSVEERDRQWLANVYRGDKEPDLTPRAVLAGMAFVAQHPEIVARLEQLAAETVNDLGISGMEARCRPLGKVEHPQPIIDYDGMVRPTVEAQTPR